jgi:hypothetical protein
MKPTQHPFRKANAWLFCAAACAAVTGCIDFTSSMVHDDDRNTPRYKKDVAAYERQGYTLDEATRKADSDVLTQNWNR